MMSKNGPDGWCVYNCVLINFGALQSLPIGYSVWWHGEHEHYQAHGPDYESCITVNRFHARKWCFMHAFQVKDNEWIDSQY